MGKGQLNIVVINGNKYSVDTGKLMTQPAEVSPKSPNAVPMARLAPRTPHLARLSPQKIDHHPNHTDLRQTNSHSAKPVNPLSRNSADGITSRRPKSIKSHRPAAKVHAKLTINEQQDRVKQSKLPKISHISTRHNPTPKKHHPVSTRIDLGSAHLENQRLRAAQIRKNAQISKFAAARRTNNVRAPQLEHVSLDNFKQPHPKAIVPAIAEITTPTIEERIEADRQALNKAIARHHPRFSSAHRKYHAGQEAVASATAQVHQEKSQEKVSFWQKFGLRQSYVSVAAITISVLLIVGYVTYLNIPNVAMRVAASRAGFDASLPAYTPDGFGFKGPIAYNSGQVVVDFSSHSDKRSYSVSQRESNWDSKSLLENAVKAESDNYLTFQDRGLTIYVYDGSKASWVNRGIWYTIEGDSKLNTDQLLKIAASL